MRMIDSVEAKLDSKSMRSSCSASARLAEDQFINAWIDVGKCFGFSHTAAEVHGLLYICGRPQCTDDVMERLNMSRGNVSMCLRTLRDWGVVRRVHQAGVRKEYFESLANIWDIFKAVVANRVGRHMNPALTRIRQCKMAVPDYAGDRSSSATMHHRLDDIEIFIASMNAMSQQLHSNAKLLPGHADDGRPRL